MATVAPRRYSENELLHKQSGKAQGRASSLTDLKACSVNGEAGALAVVPEDEAANEDKPDSAALRRQFTAGWGRRLSWISGWTFAGSEPVAAPVHNNNELEHTNTNDGEYAKTNGRMSRLRSSISALSETFMRDNEPSHETNFPSSPSFPQTEGYPMTLAVYGSIDSLTATGMRVQIPRGSAIADFTQQMRYQEILEYMKPKMRDGDMLVRPFVHRFAKDRNLAMVVRGAMQNMVFKCMIVGVFPMTVFGEKIVFESYDLDVTMYDPSGSFALQGSS